MTAQPLTAEPVDDDFGDPRPAEHTTWMELAACRNQNPGWWWGAARDFPTRRNALTVCRTCPVQRECLSYALAYDERYGIWGGRDPQARVERRRDVARWLADLDAFHAAWSDARREQW